MTYTLAKIMIYPIKSLRGIDVTQAVVESRGLQHDRRWMVVDAEGAFVTQRKHPHMALVDVGFEPEGAKTMTLSAPGQESITFPCFPEAQAPEHQVQIWRSECRALDMGEEPARWLSEWMKQPCRLVYMPSSTRRDINPLYATGEGIVSFADGYPCLVISQASLDDLNQRLEQAISMKRFRPTFVVEGAEPFAEDEWCDVQIGHVLMKGVKGCDRCHMITIDPATGQKGKEPSATLSTYRKRDGKIWFGQNLIPLHCGTVSVGDTIKTT